MADGTVIRSGWATTESGLVIKTWRRRFFVLRTRVAQDKLERRHTVTRGSDGDHDSSHDGLTRPACATHALLYFKSRAQASNGYAPTGTIAITRGATVASEEFKKNNRCIRIMSPGDPRAYFMAAEGGIVTDGASNRAWIQALTELRAPVNATEVRRMTLGDHPAAAAAVDDSVVANDSDSGSDSGDDARYDQTPRPTVTAAAAAVTAAAAAVTAAAAPPSPSPTVATLMPTPAPLPAPLVREPLAAPTPTGAVTSAAPESAPGPGSATAAAAPPPSPATTSDSRTGLPPLAAEVGLRPAPLAREPLVVPTFPSPLEMEVWSRAFAAPIALLKDAVYGSSPTFWLSRFEEKNYTDVSIADWVDNCREVKYTIPRQGLQGKIAVQSTETIVVDSTDAVVVEIETRTPGVPYGGSFRTCTQHAFCTDGGDPSRGAVVTTTAAVKWLKPCSVKGTITKKIKQAMLKGLTETMESLTVAWEPLLPRS